MTKQKPHYRLSKKGKRFKAGRGKKKIKIRKRKMIDDEDDDLYSTMIDTFEHPEDIESEFKAGDISLKERRESDLNKIKPFELESPEKEILSNVMSNQSNLEEHKQENQKLRETFGEEIQWDWDKYLQRGKSSAKKEGNEWYDLPFDKRRKLILGEED